MSTNKSFDEPQSPKTVDIPLDDELKQAAREWNGLVSKIEALKQDNAEFVPAKGSLGDGLELHLRDLESKSQIPDDGRGKIILARVGGAYHLRVFDKDGNRVIDKAEPESPRYRGEISKLKKDLEPCWRGFAWPDKEPLIFRLLVTFSEREIHQKETTRRYPHLGSVALVFTKPEAAEDAAQVFKAGMIYHDYLSKDQLRRDLKVFLYNLKYYCQQSQNSSENLQSLVSEIKQGWQRLDDAINGLLESDDPLKEVLSSIEELSSLSSKLEEENLKLGESREAKGKHIDDVKKTLGEVGRCLRGLTEMAAQSEGENDSTLEMGVEYFLRGPINQGLSRIAEVNTGIDSILLYPLEVESVKSLAKSLKQCRTYKICWEDEFEPNYVYIGEELKQLYGLLETIIRNIVNKSEGERTHTTRQRDGDEKQEQGVNRVHISEDDKVEVDGKNIGEIQAAKNLRALNKLVGKSQGPFEIENLELCKLCNVEEEGRVPKATDRIIRQIREVCPEVVAGKSKKGFKLIRNLEFE